MAIVKKRQRVVSGLSAVLAVAAGLVALLSLCLPAAAQFWGDRYQEPRYNQPPQRDYFSFPFSNGGFIRPPPVVDSTRAPPARKLETPPVNTVVVIGDSMADWLAYGLDETYADQPDTGFERKVRAYSGLIHYDTKNDALDWPQAMKDALANEKPNAIIVMLGLNDRISLRASVPPPAAPPKKADTPAAATQPAQASPPATAPAPADTEAAQPNNAAVNEAHVTPGGSYEFHTDQWALLYAKRIDDMIAVLKAKGVPVLWVGLPALRGAKSTSDMSYLDEIYRERAEKAGVTYVDIWDGFVDERGQFAIQGPDFEGQIRRLRTGDGVHFTKPGAVKLASYVDHELRRLMSNHVTPVALPGPEENAPPKPGVAGRPDVGPVVPLASSGGSDSGDLLGSNRPAQATPDPVAAKVLSRGDPIAAPAGRADDFSWPRPGTAADATPDVAPQPVALTPAPPAKKGATAADAKKPSDGKKDAKK